MHVDSIFGLFTDIFLEVGSDLCVEHEGIDGDMGTSGVGLHGSSHEALGEEEGRDPIRVHGAVLNPLSKEGYPFDEVVDPRG